MRRAMSPPSSFFSSYCFCLFVIIFLVVDAIVVVVVCCYVRFVWRLLQSLLLCVSCSRLASLYASVLSYYATNPRQRRHHAFVSLLRVSGCLSNLYVPHLLKTAGEQQPTADLPLGHAASRISDWFKLELKFLAGIKFGLAGCKVCMWFTVASQQLEECNKFRLIFGEKRVTKSECSLLPEAHAVEALGAKIILPTRRLHRLKPLYALELSSV